MRVKILCDQCGEPAIVAADWKTVDGRQHVAVLCSACAERTIKNHAISGGSSPLPRTVRAETVSD